MNDETGSSKEVFLCTKISGCVLPPDHEGKCTIYSEIGDTTWQKILDGTITGAERRKLSKWMLAKPRNCRNYCAGNHVKATSQVVIPYEYLCGENCRDWLISNSTNLKDHLDSLFPDGWIVRVFPEQYENLEFNPPFQSWSLGTDFWIHNIEENPPEWFPLDAWQVRNIYNSAGEVKTKRTNNTIDRGEYTDWRPSRVKDNGAPIGSWERELVGANQGNAFFEYLTIEQMNIRLVWLTYLMLNSVGSPKTPPRIEGLQRIRQILEWVLPEFETNQGIKSGNSVCPVCEEGIDYNSLFTVGEIGQGGSANQGFQSSQTTSRGIEDFHLSHPGSRYLGSSANNVALGHYSCNKQLGQASCFSLEQLSCMGKPLNLGQLRLYFSPDLSFCKSECLRVVSINIAHDEDNGVELRSALEAVNNIEPTQTLEIEGEVVKFDERMNKFTFSKRGTYLRLITDPLSVEMSVLMANFYRERFEIIEDFSNTQSEYIEFLESEISEQSWEDELEISRLRSELKLSNIIGLLALISALGLLVIFGR